MNQDTPALSIKATDLEANGKALEELLRKIPENKVHSIIDVRYGMGGWARIARRRFPKANYLGYEQDRATAKVAWKDSQGEDSC